MRVIARLLRASTPASKKAPAREASSEAIRALYIGILGREVDPVSLTNCLKALDNGKTLPGIARELVNSPEKLEQLSHLSVDHSQFGEYTLLLSRFVARAAPTATVVDVGARGRTLSNSYDLLKNFGWRGLLIEAN